ncbi:MAG: HAMP domain-containing sensor histidine kinase, partial [Pseudomonadota bacterium]
EVAFMMITTITVIMTAYYAEYNQRVQYKIQNELMAQQSDFSTLKSLLSQKDKALAIDGDRKLNILNIVSHTQTSLISHVVSYSQLMRMDEDTTLSPASQEYIQCIEEAGQTLDRQIKRLVKYARIYGGTENFFIRKTTLGTILKESIQGLPNGVEINRWLDIRFEDDLTDDTEIYVDVAMWITAIEELVKNAYDAVTTRKNKRNADDIQNGYQMSIDISCRLMDGHLQISVSDNGVGTDEKHIEEKISDFGTQGDYRNFGGTKIPLGLRFAKQIAEAHQGSFDYHCKEDGGFQVSLTAPILTPVANNELKEAS